MKKLFLPLFAFAALSFNSATAEPIQGPTLQKSTSAQHTTVERQTLENRLKPLFASVSQVAQARHGHQSVVSKSLPQSHRWNLWTRPARGQGAAIKL